MLPFYPCPWWEQSILWQLVVLLFQTNSLLDWSWWDTWIQYFFYLYLWECRDLWNLHIALTKKSLWPVLVVHAHTSGCVPYLFGRSARFDLWPDSIAHIFPVHHGPHCLFYSLTAKGPYLAHIVFRASFKVHKFANFVLWQCWIARNVRKLFV
jgi:hypothetical protein